MITALLIMIVMFSIVVIGGTAVMISVLKEEKR
jgi:hypothetical protein